jgi:hypothetical protein
MVINDAEKIKENAKNLKEKRMVPNDVLFFFIENEILYLDYKRYSWNIGDIENK